MLLAILFWLDDVTLVAAWALQATLLVWTHRTICSNDRSCGADGPANCAGNPAAGGDAVMMLTFLGGFVALLFSFMLFTAVTNWLFFPRLRRPQTLSSAPRVSILIPARNEAAVIADTVRAVLAQHGGEFRVPPA
jgi:hypothetical protein